MAFGRQNRIPWWSRLTVTPAGWLFLVVTLLMGIAAGQSQAALIFVVFGAMVGAFLASALLAWRTVTGVIVRRDMPAKVWQNQTVHLAYHLRNPRKRAPCLDIKIDETAQAGIESVGGYCVQLPAQGVFRAGARFAARKRGRIDLQAVELSTQFPFGLLAARRSVKLPSSLVVWPALGQLKRRLLYRGAVETSSAAPSRSTGGQDEFFGLREYREGDSPRWIHWRKSATTAVPVIREMARPLPESLWLIVDTYWPNRLSVANKRREKLLRFSGTLIDHSLNRGYQVGLAMATSKAVTILRPSDGRGQRSSLLDALADADENTKIPLGEVLTSISRGYLRKSQVIAIAPESPELWSVGFGSVRSECRSLTIITEKQLGEVFRDDPLAGEEGNNAAEQF